MSLSPRSTIAEMNRRWFQFDIATLLALIAVLAWALSLPPYMVEETRYYYRPGTKAPEAGVSHAELWREGHDAN